MLSWISSAPSPVLARQVVNQSINHWWRMTGSNRRPPACKAGALPAELIPRSPFYDFVLLRFPRLVYPKYTAARAPCMTRPKKPTILSKHASAPERRSHACINCRQGMVGLVGFEPTTPALSRRCSNRLSYRPTPVATILVSSIAGDNFLQPISVGVSIGLQFPERR